MFTDQVIENDTHIVRIFLMDAPRSQGRQVSRRRRASSVNNWVCHWQISGKFRASHVGPRPTGRCCPALSRSDCVTISRSCAWTSRDNLLEASANPTRVAANINGASIADQLNFQPIQVGLRLLSRLVGDVGDIENLERDPLRSFGLNYRTRSFRAPPTKAWRIYRISSWYIACPKRSSASPDRDALTRFRAFVAIQYTMLSGAITRIFL